MSYQPTREEFADVTNADDDAERRVYIANIIAKAESAALASAPQPSELAQVRTKTPDWLGKEIVLVCMALDALAMHGKALKESGCDGLDVELSKEWEYLEVELSMLLTRRRELMAAQPAPAAPAAYVHAGLRERLTKALEGEMGDAPTDNDIVQAVNEWAAAVKLIPEDCLDSPEVAELHESLKIVLERKKEAEDALAKARADAFDEAAEYIFEWADTPGMSNAVLESIHQGLLAKALST